MNIDTDTVDRIVAGVLNQLAADGDGVDGRVSREATPSATGERGTVLTANVVTAEVLRDAVNGNSQVIIGERAIVTPAAWDIARERGWKIVRDSAGFAAHWKRAAQAESTAAAKPLLIVVRNTDAADRLWDDVNTTWRRELHGCPDDAAALATSALCRGESAFVVILAEQAHRAACLANRNERIKAVAIRDAGEVHNIEQQLRANVWCLDPADRSWFELRNLLRAIAGRVQSTGS